MLVRRRSTTHHHISSVVFGCVVAELSRVIYVITQSYHSNHITVIVSPSFRLTHAHTHLRRRRVECSSPGRRPAHCASRTKKTNPEPPERDSPAPPTSSSLIAADLQLLPPLAAPPDPACVKETDVASSPFTSLLPSCLRALFVERAWP